MNDASNLRDTVIAKSDQLNADDLIGGPITDTVTSVSRGNSEQPVVIGITGQRPYKPCKSMRRVLITAWGDDGRVWVGRSMTLYCDPDVMFGGVKVGGIRISHLSHIDSDLIVGMNIKKGKKGAVSVKRLAVAAAVPEVSYKDYESANLPALRSAAMEGTDKLQDTFGKLPKSANKTALWTAHGESLKASAKAADSMAHPTHDPLDDELAQG